MRRKKKKEKKKKKKKKNKKKKKKREPKVEVKEEPATSVPKLVTTTEIVAAEPVPPGQKVPEDTKSEGIGNATDGANNDTDDDDGSN